MIHADPSLSFGTGATMADYTLSRPLASLFLRFKDEFEREISLI